MQLSMTIAALLFLVGTLMAADGAGAYKVTAVTASASESKAAGGYADFPPEKAIDGDLSANSSWRAEVTDEKAGQWIRFDLGEARDVGQVRIAFLKGEDRSYRFTVELSADGEKWTEAFKGASGGKQAGFETFALTPAKARYVRIRGFGNTNEKFAKWINIVEAEILPAG